VALSKERDCQVLEPWIKSLVNHLYWVPSSTPEEENELKWEKWASIVNHIQNIHEGHGERFNRCEHGDLGPAARRKRWLAPGKAEHSTNVDLVYLTVLEKPNILYRKLTLLQWNKFITNL
jgi:hypothetical protein